ncbi:MobF family relaxase [Sporichthya polymorpha]|uniref:MobF family relaxase n=1 Tax=Sporichthya polymorpha TaxID=35751 RepID=UPI0009FD8957|nr:MobF family relaxase [Sporichthya polymorpha]
MSLARLSAGSGYRYLLKYTACGDCARDAGTSLTSYYAASGYPPGRWRGRGLAGLNGGRGLAGGAVVDEEAMAALYGRGHDPVSGKPLGRAYPTYRSADERIADAVAKLPDSLTTPEREAAVEVIERRERARPVRTAVAGFDLTFTMPKSASVLWALGDPTIQRAVADAHREAVDAVLGLVEDRFLHTRIGAHSCAQVATRGMVAAAFDHWDTRTGDPNLHTHVVIANKVQGPDGVWRSVDGQAIYHAAVACSEIYDTLVADTLAARLPVTWGLRDRGKRRTPGFEIEGLDDAVLAAFSGRSAQIETHLRVLLAAFTAEHGREPNRREILRLRQQATLTSRPDKTLVPLPDLFTRWRADATAATGEAPEQLTTRALQGATAPTTAAQLPAELIERAAQVTLDGVGERRSTWTRPNLLAEAARATRLLRTTSPQERLALVDRVVEAALARCVPLDPPELFTSPARFRRADGTSTFTRPDEHAYTTTAVLAAEARLLTAAATTDAPVLTVDQLAGAGSRVPPGAPGRRLGADQQAALEAIAGSGRRVDVLVGPAGTGKTRTLRALRVAWEQSFGAGSVVALAASAVAAAELGAALGVGCENTAKWLHESTRDEPAPRWRLRPRQLVIVDEASMVATGQLDVIAAQAGAVGAKVVFVGDHHQLDAVGAGGAFGLLAHQPGAVHLTGLWRFRHRWEANATRALRAGNPAALDAYAEHGRLHGGPGELMIEAAYTAWAADVGAGRSAVLLAADRATVAALNQRAHDDRVNAGLVQPAAISLADDTAAGIGDVVVTRRNDRRLPTGDGDYVRNGTLWRITDAHPDGSIEVQPHTPAGPAGSPDRAATPPATPPAPVRLPREYVREHVELGYAATVHRAQGMTVEHGHVLVHAGMTRQQLYVALTRGRTANQAYVALDSLDPACPHPPESAPVPTSRQILERILAADGAELSATATLRRRQDEAASLRRLLPVRDTLAAAAEHGDPECGRAAGEVRRLIALRATQLRQPPQPRRHRGAEHIAPPPTAEGMSR